MTAAIANGGVQMSPNLVKTLRSPDLRVLDEPQPTAAAHVHHAGDRQPDHRVDDQWVSEGIAAGAAVPASRWPARPAPRNSGNGLNNSWFTGFAPANDPQVAVTIVMEGVDITTGAQLTSPNAKKIFEAVLNK